MGVSVVSGWTLTGAPLSAQDLWPRFMRAAGPGVVLDQGIPKSASEYLLLGDAYAEEAVEHLAVSVETQGHHKVLHVVGDRVWREGVPTKPEPFTRMPLSWTHAFGGSGFADNPAGKGLVEGDPEGVPLPNIEAPGHMIDRPGARPTPAGFGPFGIESPRRQRGLGTYDQRWLEEDFPGFARDIDWRVHNIAPEDQRFDAPFGPGQRFVLNQLVEGRPRVEVALPPVTARCFVYADEESIELEEVPLVLRTVWFVPGEDLLVLVSSGSRVVSSMLASELEGMLLGLDASDRLRPPEHFAEVLRGRLAHDAGGLAAMLDDGPLLPEGMEFPGFEERAEDLSLPERSGAMESNLWEASRLRREEVLREFEAAGFEGGEELFPELVAPAPSQEPLGVQLESAMKEAERERERAEESSRELRAKVRSELEAAGLDANMLDAEPAGPPPILASARLAGLDQAVREARAAGQDASFFEGQLQDPAFHRELLEREQMGREAYRISAHHSGGQPQTPQAHREALRRHVQAAVAARQSLAGQNLTASDLTELDLSGMDLRGAWLEGADLQKANLTGTRLDGAVLAKADLSEARLEGTSLVKANLGAARFVWTRIQNCDLSDAILAKADLRAAMFAASDLRRVDFGEARFEQTAFENSDLSGVTFFQMSLADVRMQGCSLEEANFVEVSLDRASFSGSRLTKAAFIGCRGEGVDLRGARLDNARLASGTALVRSDLRGVVLSASTLRGCSFEGSSFEGADLRGADLSQATCAGARFGRADLRRVIATECDLRGASLVGANLMEAVLQEADLRGADLSGSNLFGADLSLVRADQETSLADALVTRVRHRPLRPKETTA